MARRDVLLGITQAETAKPDRTATSGYTSRGASRSIMSSIGELAAQAAQAEKLLEGETVVELDPTIIEHSFVSDRMSADDEAFQELVAAIKERGQDSPVLVRPHPEKTGRYQIIFGHRRVRAATYLGKPVRAVIKNLGDRDHVIAQGQENSARANLTFIERAVFGQKLLELGYDRETVQSALAIDAPMLTRMTSVTKRIPANLIDAIGAAKGVGRDKWLELTLLLERPGNVQKAEEFVVTEPFLAASQDERFHRLFSALNTSNKAVRKSIAPAQDQTWIADDKSVSATMRNTGKAFNLALKSRDAAKFGAYLSDHLSSLYQDFKDSEKKKTGD